MGDQRKEKKLEKKFREIAKNKFLSPDNCTHLYQTRSYIYELNRIIKHFESKFDYIPSSAQLLFNEYNTKQERMLYERYKADYLKK
jgi:hypothetical protein